MKKLCLLIKDKYLNENLDFRAQVFNMLALTGTVLGVAIAISCVITNAGPINIVVCLSTSVLAVALIRYSGRTGRYEICYIITVAALFLVAFPILFFTAGGYHSGMPSFFIFAVLFTIFMLKGRRGAVMAALELLFYIGLCYIAYRYPQTVLFFETEQDVAADIVIGFTMAGITLGLTVLRHTQIYAKKQEQLTKANAELERLNRQKTDFLGDISHELKTPLTVISVHTQRAEALLNLGREGDAEKVRESHALIQDEITRLSRLVDSALALSSLQGHGGRKTMLDLGHILSVVTEAYRTLIEKRGNSLTLSLPNSPLMVCGNADELTQMISNLLTNANAHTEGGSIRISAEKSGETLIVTIADSGCGIAPEILPRIFERGVTDGGGHGLGLSICRNIASGHGGEIKIASEQAGGTTVTVILPKQKEAGHA